jgi:hypothetical protein
MAYSLSEEQRLDLIRRESRRIGLERMNDLFKQGFWPWNRKTKSHLGSANPG